MAGFSSKSITQQPEWPPGPAYRPRQCCQEQGLETSAPGTSQSFPFQEANVMQSRCGDVSCCCHWAGSGSAGSSGDIRPDCGRDARVYRNLPSRPESTAWTWTHCPRVAHFHACVRDACRGCGGKNLLCTDLQFHMSHLLKSLLQHPVSTLNMWIVWHCSAGEGSIYKYRARCNVMQLLWKTAWSVLKN